MQIPPGPRFESHAAIPWSRRLGVLGLYLFGFSAFVSSAGANIGIVLMLATALLSIRDAPAGWWRDPAVVLAAAAMITVSASAGWAALAEPAQFEILRKGAGQLLKPWLFLLVAFWLQGRQDRVILLLSLALLGFLLGSVRALDEDSLAALLAHQRPDFRWSINAFAQYTSASLVGLMVFLPRIWHALATPTRQYPGVLVCTLLMAILAAAVALTESRTALLGLGIILSGVVVHFYLLAPGPAGRRLMVPLMAVVALLLVAVIGLVGSAERFGFLSLQTVEELFAGGATSIQDESLDARAALLRLGLGLWWEKPLLGWGAGSSSMLIDAAGTAQPIVAGFPDFHNLFVDLLVGVGALGTLVYGLGFVVVMRALTHGRGHGCMDLDTYLLLFWLMVFEILSQMTSYRIDSIHGRFFWMLIAGSAYSCHFWVRLGALRNGRAD
ncbi:MAG: O-antigen ligase family protein [Chromatiaceae bacterium]|nr:O-antigen ligase family protein [Chromatiaceae bacterium]